MSPARVTLAVVLLVVLTADGAVIAATGPLAPMVAWAVASTLAGLLMGVALMVPAVDEAARDAGTFLSFGAGAESPAARHRVPGPPAGPFEALAGAVALTAAPFEAGRAATSAIAGRREAAAAIRARDVERAHRRDLRDLAHEREQLLARPCDPAACCEAGWACDVHAPLHQGRTSRWAHQRPTFNDLGMIDP